MAKKSSIERNAKRERLAKKYAGRRQRLKAVANDEVKSILNKVSAGLTTADLVGLNAKVSLEHQDPDAVAKAYLEQKNYFS